MKLSQAKPTLIAASIGLLLACTASAQDKASDPDADAATQSLSIGQPVEL